MQKFFKNKIKKGFTIIEIMIAISIFLIVVTIGMSSLLNASLLYQKSNDIRSALDNLSFIMEDMSKSLRTGYNYRCIGVASDLNPGSVGLTQSGAKCFGIAFESATGDPNNENDQWVYYIDNTGKLFKAIVGPYNITTNFTQMTPDEVKIDPISFFSVLGAEKLPTDKQQPFVTINIVGSVTYKNVITPFSLQTSVSERILGL